MKCHSKKPVDAVQLDHCSRTWFWDLILWHFCFATFVFATFIMPLFICGYFLFWHTWFFDIFYLGHFFTWFLIVEKLYLDIFGLGLLMIWGHIIIIIYFFWDTWFWTTLFSDALIFGHIWLWNHYNRPSLCLISQTTHNNNRRTFSGNEQLRV